MQSAGASCKGCTKTSTSLRALLSHLQPLTSREIVCSTTRQFKRLALPPWTSSPLFGQLGHDQMTPTLASNSSERPRPNSLGLFPQTGYISFAALATNSAWDRQELKATARIPIYCGPVTVVAEHTSVLQAFASKCHEISLDTWSSFHDHIAHGTISPDTSQKFRARKVILGRRCTPPNIRAPTPVDAPSAGAFSDQVEDHPGAEFALVALGEAPSFAEHGVQQLGGSQLLSATENRLLTDEHDTHVGNELPVIEEGEEEAGSRSRYLTTLVGASPVGVR